MSKINHIAKQYIKILKESNYRDLQGGGAGDYPMGLEPELEREKEPEEGGLELEEGPRLFGEHGSINKLINSYIIKGLDKNEAGRPSLISILIDGKGIGYFIYNNSTESYDKLPIRHEPLIEIDLSTGIIKSLVK